MSRQLVFPRLLYKPEPAHILTQSQCFSALCVPFNSSVSITVFVHQLKGPVTFSFIQEEIRPIILSEWPITDEPHLSDRSLKMTPKE